MITRCAHKEDLVSPLYKMSSGKLERSELHRGHPRLAMFTLSPNKNCIYG